MVLLLFGLLLWYESCSNMPGGHARSESDCCQHSSLSAIFPKLAVLLLQQYMHCSVAAQQAVLVWRRPTPCCTETYPLLLCCSTKRGGIPDLSTLRGERMAAAKPASKAAAK